MNLSRHALGIAVLSTFGCNAISGVTGVGPSGGEPENPAPPVDALDNPAHPGLEACAGGDIKASLEIAQAFKESMHELVICGGMALQFSAAFVNVFINVALELDTRPGGLTYVGDGRYTNGQLMNVVLVAPYATSFGPAGTIIPFDVFDPANYFVDLAVSATAVTDLSGRVTTELSLDFSGTGPGVELLGLGAVSGNQLTLSFDAIVDALAMIEMRQEIVVQDKRGDIHVMYHVTSDGVPIGDLLFATSAAPMEIVDATVIDAGTGQVLEVTEWAMEFDGGSAGTMDGEVSFTVTGGDFPWAGTFVYPHRKTPDVTLSCL